jgi:hypothetical protein
MIALDTPSSSFCLLLPNAKASNASAMEEGDRVDNWGGDRVDKGGGRRSSRQRRKEITLTKEIASEEGGSIQGVCSDKVNSDVASAVALIQGRVSKVSRDCGIEDKGRLYLTTGAAASELLVSCCWW